MKMRILFLAAAFFLTTFALLAEEQITITTYYPSPYGVYKQLRLYPTDDFAPGSACANRGEMYYDNSDSSLMLCTGSTPTWQVLSSGSSYWTATPGDPNSIRNTNTANVGIGTTAPGGKFEVNMANNSNYFRCNNDNNIGLELRSGTTAGSPYIDFSNDAASDYDMRLILSGNGMLSIQGGNLGIGVAAPTYQLQLSTDSAAKPTSATWTVFSDRRVKKDIRPFTDGLDVIKRINPVRYRYNGAAGMPKDASGIGVVAQDIKDIAPYTISSYKAKLNPNDKEETTLLNVNSGPLTFVLINAIKEQQKQIEALRSEVNDLKKGMSGKR